MLYARPRASLDLGAFEAQIADLDRDIAALESHRRMLVGAERFIRQRESQIAPITADVEPVSFEDALATCDREIERLVTKRDRLDAELHGEAVW